jgi:hypothetical protein
MALAMVDAMRAIALCLLAAVSTAGCVGGEYATGQDGIAQGDDGPPDFSVRMSPLSAELVLGETRTFTIDLAARHGFSGTVELVRPDVPADWEVDLPASADLAADGTAQVTMKIHVPTDTEPMAVMLHVGGVSGRTSHDTETADVLVKAELVIRIPLNALGDPSHALGGDLAVRYVSPGTKITWINDDSIAHRIHGSGVNGFDHEPDDLEPGASYSVTITAPGEFNYGCHLHSQMVGHLVVLDPAAQ